MGLHYAYFSHHKCATGWTNSILRELCFHLGLRHRTAHGPHQYDSHGTLLDWVHAHDVDFLAYTNADVEQAKALPPYRGFHVVRDPRDVLVSAYFSHRHSHPTKDWPELKQHRQRLRSLSKEEGLLKEMEFSRPYLEAMRRWDYDQSHVLEVKMEVLTSQPYEQFKRILDYLGLWTGEQSTLLSVVPQKLNRTIYALHHRVPGRFLPPRLTVESSVDIRILESILKDHAFEKMTNGRSKGEEKKDSHYRKGESGDWANHFTDRVTKQFNKAYGDLVRALGYD